MKKISSIILSILMIVNIVYVPFCSFAAEHVDENDIQTIFNLVNDLRTGSDAWYWDKDDKTKIVLNGLEAYTHDTNLEKIAKIRAEELTKKYDHTRPDGTSCFTCKVKDENGNEIGTFAENIARGKGLTAKDVFDLWCEKDDPYSGQGHRRNMLNSKYRSIGIAGVKADDGYTYWVQEFGGFNFTAPLSSATSKKTNTLTVKAKKPVVKFAKLKKKSQTIARKKAMTISNAKGNVTFKKVKGNKKISIAKNGKITVKKGLKKGSYKVKIKVTASGNSKYKAITKKTTVTVKVK